jgi:beta-glucosidase
VSRARARLLARRARPRTTAPSLAAGPLCLTLVSAAPSILLAGYRWYDAQGTKPQWVFGHGLSYSTFTYSNLNVMGPLTPSVGAIVYAEVCNTAGPAGSEIAQLYLGFPAAANEPPKLLKGFQKVSLGAGGCAGVGFPLKASDLWTWDVVGQQWILTPGQYTVMVGSTSADIRLTGALTVTA